MGWFTMDCNAKCFHISKWRLHEQVFMMNTNVLGITSLFSTLLFITWSYTKYVCLPNWLRDSPLRYCVYSWGWNLDSSGLLVSQNLKQWPGTQEAPLTPRTTLTGVNDTTFPNDTTQGLTPPCEQWNKIRISKRNLHGFRGVPKTTF